MPKQIGWISIGEIYTVFSRQTYLFYYSNPFNPKGSCENPAAYCHMHEVSV